MINHREAMPNRRLLALLAALSILAVAACQKPEETGQLGVAAPGLAAHGTTAGGAA